MNDDMYVRDISTLRISDAEEAGGKGANMGELVAAKLPVPPGFVLLRDCYRDSMRAGGVDGELRGRSPRGHCRSRRHSPPARTM